MDAAHRTVYFDFGDRPLTLKLVFAPFHPHFFRLSLFQKKKQTILVKKPAKVSPAVDLPPLFIHLNDKDNLSLF